MNQPAGLGSLKYSLAPPNAASTAWMRYVSVHVKAGVVLVFMSFQRSCNMFQRRIRTSCGNLIMGHSRSSPPPQVSALIVHLFSQATGGTADTTVDTPVLAKGRRVTLGAGAGGGPGLALPVPVFVQEGRTGGSPGGGGDECNEEFVARGGEKAVVVYSEPGCAGGEEGDAAVVAGAAGAEKVVRKMRQLMMPHAVASS